MAQTPDDQADPDLEELLAFIRDARGFDFTGYKRSSLTRRIRKRMEDISITGYADYRDRLETDAEEFRVLFNTILITRLSQFRGSRGEGLVAGGGALRGLYIGPGHPRGIQGECDTRRGLG
jgi:hypothetical protein